MNQLLKKRIEGKRVVLVAPKFHNYENIIKKELELHGSSVYLIFENLESLSYFYRFVKVYLRIFAPIIQRLYYSFKLKRLRSVPDYLLVIRGSSMNPSILARLHKEWPTCEFIMYQWDSIKRNPIARRIADQFDYNYTFDPVDAKNNGWKYRPLFCSNSSNAEKEYDISYICTLHSGRLKIYEELIRLQKECNLKCYAYLFIKRMIYFKRKFIDKDCNFLGKQMDKKDIHFIPLSLERVNEIYSRSRIVVDYTDPAQNGLTMRTIESMGNHCKLLTNNEHIKDADFYDERNIYVYDDEITSIPKDFFSDPFIPIPAEIESKYKVDFWLTDLLVH